MNIIGEGMSIFPERVEFDETSISLILISLAVSTFSWMHWFSSVTDSTLATHPEPDVLSKVVKYLHVVSLDEMVIPLVVLSSMRISAYSTSYGTLFKHKITIFKFVDELTSAFKELIAKGVTHND